MLPQNLDSTELFFKAREQGILFTQGKIFHPEGRDDNGFRLNFSRVQPHQIRDGIATLGKIIRGMMNEKNRPVAKSRDATPFV